MSQLSSADIEAIAVRVAEVMSGVRALAVADVKASGVVVGSGEEAEDRKEGDVVKADSTKLKKDALGVSSTVSVSSGSEIQDTSSRSWADMVSEESVGDELSESSVEMPAGVVLSGVVKNMKFGGVADAVGAVVLPKGDAGFYGRYVRVPNVLALRELLESRCGVKLPKAALEELALVTYTTATVPVGFHNGSVRLRSLAAVGDAALSFVMVARMHAHGVSVASVQNAKSARLSNPAMSLAFSKSTYSSHVSFPSGVELGTNKLSADALEALIGVVANYRDISAVVRLANDLRLF